MSIQKWHFPSTDGGDEDGLNDALRENFEGDHERFVARETIQNSSDARLSKDPVRVRFERLSISRDDIPGREELRACMLLGKEYARGQEGAAEFYDAAVEMIDSESIPVLKISDFNTTGLNGTDTDKDGEWYRLIRSTGASSMSGAGGGSFGIGKGAPFAASALRCVFYSTINSDGEPAFQGKTRISSFLVDDDVRRGIGLFGQPQERGVGAMRKPEDIPELFRRTEQGTDVFVLGYVTEEVDWKRRLLQSVLSNFWAAIHFGELIVSFVEGEDIEEVNAANLRDFLLEVPVSVRENPLYFYRALTEGERINASVPWLGECSLYVVKEDAYPKMVQMMRMSKMVIKTTPPSTFRVLAEPFAAVFLCNNNTGNERLRALEPPAHNDWDPERDKRRGQRIIRELNDFIRNSLRSLAENTENAPEEIPELSYYLPFQDDVEDDKAESGEQEHEDSTEESPFETGATKEQTEAPRSPAPHRRAAVVRKAGLGGKRKSLRSGVVKKRKTKQGSVDPSLPGRISYVDVGKIAFRARQVSKDGQVLYRATIHPTEDDSGALKITAVGEDARYPLELEWAETIHGERVAAEGSLLKDLDLKKDVPIQLNLKFKNARRYAIGVSGDDNY